MKIAIAPSLYSLIERTGHHGPTRAMQSAARSVLVTILMLLAGYSPLQADEKTLYEQPSPYNHIMVTEDERGFRTLYFEKGGAMQSVVKPGDPDHLELPYARAMLSGLALQESPRRILVVGLGGGSIPKFLHKHYPRAVIDAVDIDPDVLKVARQFFEFREDVRLRAHIMDGRRFVKGHPRYYDLIFLDAFGADSIPYHLATREFLLLVRKALTPRGVVLGNIWNSASNPLHDSMIRTYLNVFGELCRLDVSGAGNEILITGSHQFRLSREDFAARARRVSRSKGFRFDMGDAVEYGYHRIDRQFTSGQVLKDGEKPTEAK